MLCVCILLQDYIQQCSRSRDELLQRLGDRKYYMDHLELYALRDLIAISEKGGDKFSKGLEATLAHYAKHISTDCLVRSTHMHTRILGPSALYCALTLVGCM